MADFTVCPSSERTMSVLPPFCRGAVKTGRFYRKVVSEDLFADTLPNSQDCTAQSLSRFATAPFTQGSPWRVPFTKQLVKLPISRAPALTGQLHPNVQRPEKKGLQKNSPSFRFISWV